MNLCKGFRLLWTACRMTRHQHNPRNIDIAYTTLSASTNGTALFLPKHTVDSELLAGLCISFNIYIVLNEIKLSVDKCNTQVPQRSEILIVAVIMGRKKKPLQFIEIIMWRNLNNRRKTVREWMWNWCLCWVNWGRCVVATIEQCGWEVQARHRKC